MFLLFIWDFCITHLDHHTSFPFLPCDLPPKIKTSNQNNNKKLHFQCLLLMSSFEHGQTPSVQSIKENWALLYPHQPHQKPSTVEGCGLCSSRRPCWCWWSMCQLETRLLPMIQAAGRNHVIFRDPCCCCLLWVRKLLLQLMTTDS